MCIRDRGMRIGTGTKLFSKPSAVLIDLTRPWLIDIGKNVQITIGVKILTHGYDWSVSVSYTHLDVYKRQLERGPGRCTSAHYK